MDGIDIGTFFIDNNTLSVTSVSEQSKELTFPLMDSIPTEEKKEPVNADWKPVETAFPKRLYAQADGKGHFRAFGKLT